MRVETNDYQRLIEPIRDRMVNSIWRILRDPDDTEDVVQEVLERVYKRLDRIRRHPNPTALILRICINTAYDRLRRTLRKREAANVSELTGVPVSPDCLPSEVAAQKEELERVLRAIGELPRREGEALLLLALEGFSYPEVAGAMRCRESTVRSMVSKARRRLQLLLRCSELDQSTEVESS